MKKPAPAPSQHRGNAWSRPRRTTRQPGRAGAQTDRFSTNASGRRWCGGDGGSQEFKAHARAHTHALTDPEPPSRGLTAEFCPRGGPGRRVPSAGQLLCFLTRSFWEPRRRATTALAHTEYPHLSAKPSLTSQRWTGGGEKKSRGWFLRVIIFIPEQLEDTSLNVLPKSQPSEIRAGGGAGVFTMLHGSKPHTHTHTRHSVSLKIHGLPGTLRALSVRSQSEELLLRKVSVNVHVGLVDVADYGTGGGPVGAEQEGDSLFPVGKTNTGALWEERKGLVSMGRPH